ncbi:hypothetical protein [Pseudoalteromonas ruthenica]|uniref:hypothetical protein n=1 Tax=Pseudoalteromonas ruthenica TaxID=151081 RepID=UPI00110B4C6B|nr:hypothetical protein [Pseudoalteromonas ruthenica]
MLTPAKQAVSMWCYLADAIQHALTQRIGATEKTIVDNQSLLTMSISELNRRQNELGLFFSVISVPDEEKGLALVHRLDQIHLKATEFPVKDMVRRSFNDLDMDWLALYAPIDQSLEPYGTRFIDEIAYSQMSEANQSTYFLTSRGRMVLNLNKFMPAQEEMDNIYSSIKETIVPMLPLDIVFDGFFTQVKISASFTIHESYHYTEIASEHYSLKQNAFFTASAYADISVHFNIVEDWHSVDSPSRSIRKPFDDRVSPLLSELHINAMPLGAPYNLEKYRDTNPDPSLGPVVLDGLSWQASGGMTKPVGHRVNVSSNELGFVCHPIACALNKRYAMKVRKYGDNDCRVILSRSNTPSGAVLELVSEMDVIGTYSTVFSPTHITMYLIIIAPATGDGLVGDISVNELIEI